MKNLEYPEGSVISWCNEYYKVIDNSSDWSGKVMDTAGYIAKFYFNFAGEKAILVTDSDIIQKVNNWIKESQYQKTIQ